MTVGIGAAGPGAGAAVLRALRAVEAAGEGAIGGFVSLVALGPQGVLRAETQRGGTGTLFGGGAVPDAVARAERAGVISSGPDRPEPLSRFTPADPAVGLVTGHRMPDAPGTDGAPLNQAVLAWMRRGLGPAAAVRRVLAANPAADAGLIAVSTDGRVGLGDARAVAAARPDAGRALLRAPGAAVGVLHNAILPHRGLARLAAEVALHAMRPRGRTGRVLVRAGVRLTLADAPRVEADEAGVARGIGVADPRLLRGRVGFGLGFAPPVLCRGQPVGRLAHEPFMVAQDGILLSADGAEELCLPVCLTPDRHAPSPGSGAG